MSKQGKRTEKFFALARYSGKPKPYDTEIYGRFSQWADAAQEKQFMGGHVVHVVETIEWKPVKIANTKETP